jgi:hypothetical protein
VWDVQKRDVVRSAQLGFPIAGLAFSNEEYGLPKAAAAAAGAAAGSAAGTMVGPGEGGGIRPESAMMTSQRPCYHLALGSAGGYE